MFKDKLRELRENNGYSMDKLAEVYNKKFNGKLNKSTISRYENGLQEPIYTVVYNFAKLFQITVDEMIDKTPTVENKPSGIYAQTQGMVIQFLKQMRKASSTDIERLTGIPYSRLKEIELFWGKITDEEIEKITEVLGGTLYMAKNSFIPSDMSDPYIAKIGRTLNDLDYILLELYNKLDYNDKAEIRGEMKHMLKADKYTNGENGNSTPKRKLFSAPPPARVAASGMEVTSVENLKNKEKS